MSDEQCENNCETKVDFVGVPVCVCVCKDFDLKISQKRQRAQASVILHGFLLENNCGRRKNVQMVLV